RVRRRGRRGGGTTGRRWRGCSREGDGGDVESGPGAMLHLDDGATWPAGRVPGIPGRAGSSLVGRPCLLFVSGVRERSTVTARCDPVVPQHHCVPETARFKSSRT